jgi:hypothetical protein
VQNVGFEVLTAVSMKIAVFWVVAPCSLVEVYQRFRAIALMMEAARTSETLVNFYQTTRCYNPEDSNLHTKKLFKKPSLSVSSIVRTRNTADSVDGTFSAVKN